MVVDPLAYVRPWESPYVYCGNNPLTRVDKDGQFWGAVIGAAVEYGFQVYETKSWVPTNEGWAKIGVSAAAGLASGGLSSMAKTYRAGKIIATVALNVGEGVAKKVIDGKQITASGVAADALIAVGTSKVGDMVDNTLSKQIQKAGNAGVKAGQAAKKLQGSRNNSKTSRATYNKNTTNAANADANFQNAANKANTAMTLENVGVPNAASATSSAATNTVVKIIDDEEK